MRDIVERLRFDAVRCELQFSKGVASNIEEGIAEIERLRALLENACEVFDHYDLPEHAFHYRRILNGKEAAVRTARSPAEKTDG